jgi:hypothetical protein
MFKATSQPAIKRHCRTFKPHLNQRKEMVREGSFRGDDFHRSAIQKYGLLTFSGISSQENTGIRGRTGCNQQAIGSKGCSCSSSSAYHRSCTCKEELPKLFHAMDRMEKMLERIESRQQKADSETKSAYTTVSTGISYLRGQVRQLERIKFL